MVTAYTTAIRLYGAGIRLAQPFSRKASSWIKGRKNLFERLQQAIAHGDSWIWVHVASLGEFEQGRPIIESIRSAHPEKCIVLTFFSPSGYDIRKNYPGADYVAYMPLDTPANARRFLDIVNPKLAIFIKYDIWFHHFQEMLNRDIPILLVSAQFRSEQIYFKRIGKMFIPLLKNLRQIFVVDEGSRSILIEKNFENVVLGGDTRIDRVLDIAKNHRNFECIRLALQSEDILVAGSTWPGDMRHLLPLINSGKVKCVIAPHENHEENLLKLEEMITVRSARLSQIMHPSEIVADVVIVDTMGDLVDIYHVGRMAYVGGGFDSGIHNILEPVAHQLPVLFGPNHAKFSEAQELIELGVCRVVNSSNDIDLAVKYYCEEKNHTEIVLKATHYMNTHAGATAHVYDYIRRERLL